MSKPHFRTWICALGMAAFALLGIVGIVMCPIITSVIGLVLVVIAQTAHRGRRDEFPDGQSGR